MELSTILVFATSVSSLILAIFVYFQGANRLTNITLSLFSLAICIWTFGQGMGAVLSQKELVLFWTKINVGAAVILPPLYLHFVLSILGKKNKYLLLFMYLFAFGFILFLFTPYFVEDVASAGGFRFYPQGGIVYPFFALYLISIFMYGFVQLAVSLAKEQGEQKTKLIYIFAASIIGFSGGVTAFFPVFGINFPVISHFALPVYVAITAYAILKHKLLDIEVVIRQGLVYSILTVFFAGVYALIILIANKMLVNYAHLNEYLGIILAVAASVAVFQPLKDIVQHFVDKLFFRGSYYYEKTIDDLSEQNRKMFQSLLRADKLASLGTLSAGMAHEIKNPLAAIKGMTQILPDKMSDPEFIKDYMDLVPRQLDRINGIVENLLRAGKPSKIEKKLVNINNVVDEILDFYSNMCEKNNIVIDKALQALPQIYADPEQIHQAISNLVINAIQAMPNGGTLSLSSYEKQGKICIEIEDTGIGIAPDKIEKIFDPFFSLKEKGTGLGLFVAYRIVQEHGGAIEVSSDIGKGTNFKLWLYTKPKG